VPYLELVLFWNIFDMYRIGPIGGSSSRIVQVLLKVTLQGFKVDKLTVTSKNNFLMLQLLKLLQLFFLPQLFVKKWFLKFRNFHLNF
jgi:hypothetical protein